MKKAAILRLICVAVLNRDKGMSQTPEPRSMSDFFPFPSSFCLCVCMSLVFLLNF